MSQQSYLALVTLLHKVKTYCDKTNQQTLHDDVTLECPIFKNSVQYKHCLIKLAYIIGQIKCGFYCFYILLFGVCFLVTVLSATEKSKT